MLFCRTLVPHISFVSFVINYWLLNLIFVGVDSIWDSSLNRKARFDSYSIWTQTADSQVPSCHVFFYRDLSVFVALCYCWRGSKKGVWPIGNLLQQSQGLMSVSGPGRRVPKSHCSCCSSSCCYRFSKSPKIPKAFLICSGVQQNFAYTFVLTLPSDLPSQIFHLFSD